MRDPEIRPGVRRLFRLAARDADQARTDADEEIRLHLQLRAAQLRREGLAPDAARAEAARRFGPVEEARRQLHASVARGRQRQRLRGWWDALRQDVGVTLRGFRRSPGFVATAVTCIALGVGVNAAAFALLDELLLRPLPVHEPERLVKLAAPGPRVGSDQCSRVGSCAEVFSHPMFRDLQRAQTAFAGIAAHRLFIAGIGAEGRTAVDGQGVFVSGSYFPLLGLRPALGRLLTPEDDHVPGGHPVAVLSHAYWRGQLGADPSVVGRSVVVNDRALRVVGVAPPGFEGTTLGVRPQLFVPLSMAAEVDIAFGPPSVFEDRLHYGIFLFARLAPDVDLVEARARMAPVYRSILADVEAPLQAGMSDATMARFLARELTVEDGRHGQSVLRGTTRTPLLFLFALTGLVVLIAAANIANLILARGASRAAEMAVRLSLGASRRRLVVQLLTESCLLAALGGVASLLVAHGTLQLIGTFVPPAVFDSGVTLSLELEPSALAFVAAVSLGTGLLFGLYPALHGTRSALITSIRAGASQVVGGQRGAARFRTTLVTAQIALSMALLASAGLFIRSVRNVAAVDLGLNAEQVVTFALVPGLNGYDPARTRALVARVEQELGALAGVSGVGGAGVPLLAGMSNGGNVRVEGFTRGPDTDANARTNQFGPGTLRALGIPLLAGRDITDADRLGAPPVALVNEAFARKFGLGRDAVGKRMAIDGRSAGEGLDVEIVGLIGDASYDEVKGAPPPLFVTSYRQEPELLGLAFYVRSSLPPGQALRAVRATIAGIDRALPVVGLKTMEQQVRDNVYLDRMLGSLSAGFAVLATLLAAVGLYGVLAYTVAQRTREFGMRMALGADAGRIRRLVLRQVARMTAVGIALGVVMALGLGRAAGALLFQLPGQDPAVLGTAAAALVAAAVGAGYLPAWRASRVSPAVALRRE